MKIETYNWTGKTLTFALVNTAKAKLQNPMLVLCSPFIFSSLAEQGFAIRKYDPPRPLKDSLIEVPNAETGERYHDGDLIWHLTTGVPDDALIISNLDEIHLFHGFKVESESGGFERTCDQMPLWLEQESKRVAKLKEAFVV